MAPRTALALASLAAVTGLAGTASATTGGDALPHASAVAHAVTPMGAGDNSGASVGGVTGLDARQYGCPGGYFCLYTGRYESGTVFRLYHCTEYDLYNWNGIGSWINNNSGGAHGYIQDQNYNVLVDSDPNPNSNWLGNIYDFSPAWHVKAC